MSHNRGQQTSALRLGALFLALGAWSCQSAGAPSSVVILALSLVSQSAVGTVPNPCELDVDFGTVSIGQQAQATIDIANQGRTPVTFPAPSTTVAPPFGASFDGLKPPLQPGATAQVPITFAPTAAGPVTSTFSIATSLPSAMCSSIAISLTGNGAMLELVVTPSSLDFGNVLLGTSVKESVTLANQSILPLTGLSAAISGADPSAFTVGSVPSSLAAGASASIEVSFAPLTVEAHSAATVTFVGAGGESATLSLSGVPLSSALTLSPNPIDFGYVTPGSPVIACTTVTDVSNVPVNLTGLGDFTTDEGAFTASSIDDSIPPNPAPLPVALSPGGSAQVCFSLSTFVVTQYTGQATLLNDAPTGSAPMIQLTGLGGGPELSCTPTSLDFGQTLHGTISTLPITCTNTGISAPNLTLSASASPFFFGAAFDLTVNPYPPDGLAPGQSAQIDASYDPAGASNNTGMLTIGSNGGRGLGLQIPLSGQGLVLTPCQFLISPTSLDFGNVPDGGVSAPQSFEVDNLGSDACLVKDLAIVGDGGGEFQLLSTSIQPDSETHQFTIPAPGSGAAPSLTVTLAYAPLDAGVASAEANFWISNPANLDQAVPLRGTSGSPCLVFVPSSVDFGQVGTSDAGALCGSASRSIAVFNQCSAQATLQSFSVQSAAGDTVQQFSAPAGPAVPLAIGQEVETYDVFFQPTTLGSHSAQLVFSEGSVDTLVPVTGTAVAAATETDSFTAGPPKADILFVRDIGDDVYSEPLVAANMADFLDAGAGTDYRLAVTTDDNPQNPEPNYGGWPEPCPSCFATGPEPVIVSPTSTADGGSVPDPVAVFVDLLGDGPEGRNDTGTYKDKHLFVALYEALERDPRPGLDFFRPGAYFAVVNESGDDDPDGSFTIHPTSWFVSFFTTWFPDSSTFSWSYINPTQTITGTGLADPMQVPPAIESLLSATGGLALNTADANWPQPFLSLWSAAAAANLIYGLQTVPPAGQTGMTVRVAGTVVSDTNWTYEPSNNAVVFSTANAPANGDQVEISYPIACP